MNDALRDLFECFDIAPVETGMVIAPVLLGARFDAPQTFFSIANGDEEIAPPLRALSAPARELTNSQAITPLGTSYIDLTLLSGGAG